ncbi:hypothetical protein [Enterovirga rhinocerotis]|uniref:Nitrate reductase n=1 Tax=Enterovirga rhinocerotis TaxID=1339210 RepID=A0A4R7BXF2_9HYPH|nr:hypothetical protein [Enterovirga rhinocerotis]TDR89902.1 hypothetical protein EV668_2738 [Enterovirga rhinocerotis]
MLRGLFAKRAGIPDPDRVAAERVKALAASLLALPDGAEITVSEIVCLDPACPGTETVILVMPKGGKTRAAKVAAPAAEVGEPELRSALVEAGFGVGA